jgi:hypothetical protein
MYWNKILDLSLSKLYENKNNLEEFKSLKSNYQRVDFLIRKHYFLNEVNIYLKYVYDENNNNNNKTADLNESEEKNIQLSHDYRLKGNDYYAKKQFKLAFKYYTLSLLYAPSDFIQNKCVNKSKILALSNRSAIFFNEKLYQETLIDLNSIKEILCNNFLQCNFIDIKPDDISDIFNLIIKLINREANCYYNLKQLDKLNEFLNDENKFQLILKCQAFLNMKSEQKINETNSLIKNLFDKLTNLPANIENLKKDILNEDEINQISSSVDIKFSSTKGRHCIANKNIDLGETIFVEEPYAAILLPEFISQYCKFCFKKMVETNEIDLFKYNNIEFCFQCTTVLYCSIECKKADLHTHKFECKIIKSILHNLGIAHLAYEILIKTDMNLIKKYARDEIDFDEENLINQIDYRKFDNSELSYHQVFSLMTHESDTHVDDLFKYTLTSILLGEHYLNVEPAFNKSEMLCMISSLILRHLLQTICNAHAITQLRDNDITSNQTMTYDREQIRYATAIYPRVSLLNHSCDSNILSSFRQDSKKIIIKASRKINKNDEIFNCYGPHYLKMNLFSRQQSLIEQYKFKCDCSACINQMNSLNSNENNSLGLRCLKCRSSKMRAQFKFETENFKFDELLHLRCTSCQSIIDLKDYTRFFDQVDIDLEKLDFSSNHKSVRNLEIISRYIEKFKNYLLINENNEIELISNEQINEYFKIFYLNYSKLLDMAARMNCNLKLFEKASEITSKNIRLLELIYKHKNSNENVVEIAHELFKLAEIQCNCFKFREALYNIDRAIELAKNIYSERNHVMDDFIDLRNNIISILKE